MRISIPWWSRAVSRPRKLLSTRLGNPNNSAARKWSRETASVLEMVLRNRAPLPWKVLPKYAKMPPQLADIEPLLPMLEERALQEQRNSPNSAEGIDSLGDFALTLGVVSQLSRPFLAVWINQLATKDAYAALRIFKLAKSLPISIGVDLYLKAHQPIKAHQMAGELDHVVPKLRRKLIGELLNQQHLDLAQEWIDGWQALQPTDIRWLHHLANQHHLADKNHLVEQNHEACGRPEWALRLPKLPEKSTVPQPSRKIGEGLQHLVSRLNHILVAVPDLLAQAPVHTAWVNSISEPSQESVENLSIVIAKFLANHEYTPNWLPILRLIRAHSAIKILRICPKLSAKAYAVVISRSSPENLDTIVGLMTPELFYSAECLHAVAQTNPGFFAEMTVPQSFLETKLQDHHLMALWQADFHSDWLFPLTLQNCSPRLLRAALKTLVKQRDRSRAEQLLTNFVVTQKLVLDPQLLQLDRLNKLGAPQRHDLEAAESKLIIDHALSKLFDANIS